MVHGEDTAIEISVEENAVEQPTVLRVHVSGQPSGAALVKYVGVDVDDALDQLYWFSMSVRDPAVSTEVQSGTD